MCALGECMSNIGESFYHQGYLCTTNGWSTPRPFRIRLHSSRRLLYLLNIREKHFWYFFPGLYWYAHTLYQRKTPLLEEWRCVGRKNNFKAKNGVSTVFNLMPSCFSFDPKMPFFEINVEFRGSSKHRFPWKLVLNEK